MNVVRDFFFLGSELGSTLLFIDNSEIEIKCHFSNESIVVCSDMYLNYLSDNRFFTL